MTKSLAEARKLAKSMKDIDRAWASEWGMGMEPEDLQEVARQTGADPEKAVKTSLALSRLRRADAISAPMSFDWKEQDLLRDWMQLEAGRGHKYFYDLMPPGQSDTYVPIASKVKLPLHKLGG